MGTLPDEPQNGLIYLQNNVSTEFDKERSKTKHTNSDTFLEHLFDLFFKSNPIQLLNVRYDLAQKFSALLSSTQFGTSDDLMKHLLELHLKSVKENEAQKPACDSRPAGTRKSRKSQPRRRSWIESQAVIADESLEDSVSPDWPEQSTSGEDGEISIERATGKAAFDLSVVKQEVEEEETLKAKTDKDADDQPGGPLCLSLHQSAAAQDSQTPPTSKGRSLPQHGISREKPSTNAYNHVHDKHVREREGSIEANIGNTRQFAQPNWRSRSEPATGPFAGHVSPEGLQNLPQQPIAKGPRQNAYRRPSPSSINSGPMYPILGQILDKRRSNENQTQNVNNNRSGYNYVLDSLASPPGDKNKSNQSLPASPMQVPLKYPKSSPYAISDEEEPQDLSCSPSQKMPQNLSIIKPTEPMIDLTAKTEGLIKYDRNANAVSMIVPIAQPQDGQFNLPPPFSAPPNLIFHDPKSINSSSSDMIGEPPLLTAPGKNSKLDEAMMLMAQNNMMKQHTAINSQPVGAALVGGTFVPPGLPLLMTRGPRPNVAPIFVPQGMLSPTSRFAAASPPSLAPAVSPERVSVPAEGKLQPNGIIKTEENPSEENDIQEQLRKKRKKMDDTTAFRDPPEQSLPFNGPNKYRFYCDVCDTGFTRRYTFNRHKCKGRVEKHYCQLCDKAYLSKYKLKDHILVKHEGQTVSCPECGKRFSSRSSMEMHKKQQHEGQFSIWCKICGKGFNHTGHYYGHMNKHTNTKPFWCQQCGKRFYGSSYLHNHKQVCRGNTDLNYACNLCDRRFKCELYLKKHLKVHDSTPIIDEAALSGLEEGQAGGLEEGQAGGLEGQAGLEEGQISGIDGMDLDTGTPRENGEIYESSEGLVSPNGPENSDSNSNSGMLVIDENGKKMAGADDSLQEEDSDIEREDTVVLEKSIEQPVAV